MKILESFYLQILFTVAITLILGLYPVLYYLPNDMIISIACGASVSIINVLIGNYLIHYAINKPNRVFFKAIIGGLAVRLFFIGIALVCMVKVFKINILGLVISLFFYYFLFLVLEIMYLNKRLLKRNINPVK
jgi:hypothetical protein